MSRDRARKVWLAVFVWCVLFGLLVGGRQYTFRSAIVHDEGVFLYGGMAWAAGELPYRDFWDHKPPGITLFHAIPIRLFGYSLQAVRLHEVLWLAVSATIFFYLCRMHLGAGAVVLSVLFYCLLVSTKLVIRSGGLTEESALTFHSLSYVFALRRRGSPGWNVFLAGLFLGVAAEFRQPFGLSVVFIVLCLLWRPEGSEVPWKKRVGLLPVLAVGAVIPETVCSGYFLMKGIWGQYIEGSYLFSFLYMGGGPDAMGLGAGMQKHWQMMKATGPYLASPVFAAPLLFWLPRRLKRVGVLFIVAFLCDFVAISLGGRYYEHYYLQATVSSCFLLGIAFEAIYAGMRGAVLARKGRLAAGKKFLRLNDRRMPTVRVALFSTWRRRILSGLPYWCAGAIVGLWVLLSTGAVRNYLKSYRLGLEEKRSGASGEYARQEEIGKAIRTLTGPDERILLLGSSPTSVYFTAQRLAGSRYYHLSPFFRKAFFKSVGKRHRERFLSDLAKRKPVLIVLARGERQYSLEGMEMVRKSPAGQFLIPYLKENYVAFAATPGEVAPLEGESLYRLSEIRRRLRWGWYRSICLFLIRKDKAEEVKRRLEAAEAAGL